SIEWKIDGTTVETQTAGPFRNPVIVAGGNGVGDGANQLNNPDRIWVDRNDNIYIPEISNNRVQKWAPGATAGVTVAGGNGAGSAANQLSRPAAVFVDYQGNVYVTEQYNNRISKWAPGATAGVTVAENLSTPTGIAVDESGNIYVSNETSNDVEMFAPGATTGVIVAGGHGVGTAANQLDTPTGLFLDGEGNIYICDVGNNRVQKWKIGASSGVTVAGSSLGERGSAASLLYSPLDVCVDAFGNLYITDYLNGRVQEWPAGATSGITLANNITCAGIMIDVNNNLFVADYANGSVFKFTNPIKGTYTTLAPGKYSAAVTSKDGCTAVTNNITVKATAIPLITISANTTISCAQVPTLFKAEIADGGQSPLYQWQVNGVNSGANGHSPTFSSSDLVAGDVVSCLLTSSLPCATLPVTASNSIILTNPTEVCSVNITSNVSTICQGTAVTFKAVATNGGTAPVYQWLINGNASGTGKTFSTTALNNGDKVTCKMTSNAVMCLVNNAAESAPITITVNEPLPPSVTISANTTVACAEFVPVFNAIPSNGGANPRYQWQVNGINSGPDDYSATFSNPDLRPGDVVSCVITSNSPCTAGTPGTSNSITLTNPTEVCSVSIAGDNVICQGTTANFKATPTNGGILPTFQWLINGIVSGTGDTFSSAVLNNGDKITCIMTGNAANCQVNNVANSNVITLTVNPLLTPSVSISSNKIMYYPNTSVTFTALPVNGGTMPGYQWLVNNLNVGTNSSVFTSATLANGDIVSCVLTSNAPCAVNTETASNQVTINFPPAVVPPNTFTPNNDGINDTWNIGGLSAYPLCNVSIFSRYGQNVFQSIGYVKAWDGTWKGSQLAAGPYYYIIKLNDTQTLSGEVTILR
ncbi:MAG TPA: gliding motility-associated C-terminal domain-containing protein, partial [Mucilaginibacter sp.]